MIPLIFFFPNTSFDVENHYVLEKFSQQEQLKFSNKTNVQVYGKF